MSQSAESGNAVFKISVNNVLTVCRYKSNESSVVRENQARGNFSLYDDVLCERLRSRRHTCLC